MRKVRVNWVNCAKCIFLYIYISVIYVYIYICIFLSRRRDIVPTRRPFGAQHSPKLSSSDLRAFFGNSRPSSRGATKKQPTGVAVERHSMPGSGQSLDFKFKTETILEQWSSCIRGLWGTVSLTMKNMRLLLRSNCWWITIGACEACLLKIVFREDNVWVPWCAGL